MAYIIGIVVLVIGVVAFTFVQTDQAATPEFVSNQEEVRPPQDDTTTDTVIEDSAVSSEPAPPNEEEPDISVVSEIVADTPAVDVDSLTSVDGTYTTQTSYFTPRRTEHVMDITLTIENNVVTETEILWDGELEPKTPSHTGFEEAYEAEVIGQPLNEIYLSRVGGASLTSEAFNEAVETIEAEASAS